MSPKRARRTPEAVDSSPSRYIARVSVSTGEEVDGPIDPDELLVHAHRDKHPVEVTAQVLASRLVRLTGEEEFVRTGMRTINRLGARLAEALGHTVGSPTVARQAKRLIGVMDRRVAFKFREHEHLSEKEVKSRIARLQRDAAAALASRGRSPRLHVLLTGATGFVGKEILFQASSDRRIERLVAVVRPESVRDPKTKEVVKVLSAQERGAQLMKRLHIQGSRARKFHFVAGDIEKPDLGIAPGELRQLRRTLTHVVHCAASVSFDDPYESSFRANVLGSLNALRFSLSVQRAPGSCFVNHIAIETSYVHGRKKRSIALESALVFPRHFYNNFYELTKAMASIETDRSMIDEGLRVAQLLPSVVIGEAGTGNNRGDTKVLNAPVNAFGRSKEAADRLEGDLAGRSKAWVLSALATGFPGDPSAEINLVPVDRVVSGIRAALVAPDAIGARIHLATDNRIRTAEIVGIIREELGVNVRLVDPTLFRTITLPILKAALTRIGEPRLAAAMEKLGTIFGGYGEWGQPIHDVGNDVRILGLSIRRPSTLHAFRMLCRHNKYVQEFGRVRDGDEIARRERLWEDAIGRVEYKTGRQAASIPAREFRGMLAEEIDLRTFRRLARRRRRSAK